MNKRGPKRNPIFENRKTLVDNLARHDNNVRALAFESNLVDAAIYHWMRRFKIQHSTYEKRVPGKLNTVELKVLEQMAQGHTDRKIGTLLGLTTSTVETYRVRMRKELQVKNSCHMIATAFRNGILK